MRKLRKIKICGHTYKIHYKKELHKDGEDLHGYCDHDTGNIFLDKRLEGSRLAEVLLHECIHAIDLSLNMELGEARVNLLGIEVYRLITDNKLNLLKE